MDRRTAKEYLHIRVWLLLAQRIVDQGEEACLSDQLLQEAGDSIMMKIGEAARRLSQQAAGDGTARACLAMQSARDLAEERAAGTPKVRRLGAVAWW